MTTTAPTALSVSATSPVTAPAGGVGTDSQTPETVAPVPQSVTSTTPVTAPAGGVVVS